MSAHVAIAHKPESVTMDEAAIRKALADLEPETPWTHNFDLGYGIQTITPDNPKFFDKSVKLGKLGQFIVEQSAYYTHGHTLKGKRVLDLASAEGGHSILLAQSGAKEVVGIEGRDLYLRRAAFAAEVYGVDNVRFEKGDVRKLTPEALGGAFDVVICSGILHHLGQDDFDGFIQSLYDLTKDTLMLYTHISIPASVAKHRLKGPVKTGKGYEGYLFREHDDKATEEERRKKVRASLDNTFSFWATDESLFGALADTGFASISRLEKPHMFDWAGARYRPVIIARKGF